ncbi:TIGR03943 family protein [Treponema sp. OMZ 787]|uniref:TIGR03943 family putative permease subunit n=1 Tax=Treponema sp. OMZ 787 TaxID=2563669 RepID=UPI0020A4A616|nr:TIGR03943 family protein [Treponema sp. OMZ 787]UTC62822.1 TIGR03943 family protein [Treponema sp. OMZ 787]
MKKLLLDIFIEKIICSLLLLATSLAFIYAVASKKALLYVHVRHTGIIIFSAIVFFIIAIITMRDAFCVPHHTHAKRKNPLYLIIFLMPILFAIFIPYKTLTADSLAFNGDILSFQKQKEETGPNFNFRPSRLLELEDGFVVMDNETFGRWLPELYLNLDSWLDKKIKIEGAVWKNPEVLSENEFAIGRMLMVCCAADMQPAGLVAQWTKTEEPQEDDWVRVTGTISKTEYEGSFEPLIIVDNIEIIPRPALEYVYPF